MARLWPERLPGDTSSGAERRLFDVFKSEFSDDFPVFAQVKWMRPRRTSGATEGEADFVVAHPRYGVLVLEVKGGGIRFDAAMGEWYSTDRTGAEHHIKDPFGQAQRSMHALKDFLRESDSTRPFHYPLAYAVSFPDVHLDGRQIAPSAPPQIVFDLARVRSLKQAVIDAWRFTIPGAGEKGPGDEGIEALTGLLARSWQVEATVGSALDQQERVIRLLTEEQFSMLDFLGNHRRALISGCAGSGKTMLAIEKARWLALSGFRVLFTCFNQNLSAWVSTQLAGTGVEVRHFHSLCAHFAALAEIELEQATGEPLGDFFGRFPDVLMEASQRVPDRFDAIIVDEGQDFEEEWWVALLSLLEHPDDDILYIFFDDNQQIYTRRAVYPINGDPFVLPKNCRNTQQIHEVVMHFYRSEQVPTCIGPDGEPPKLVQLEGTGGERRTVEDLIEHLVTKQGIEPWHIALLTPRTLEKSAWKTPPRKQNWEGTWDLAEASGKVVFSSIHAFKGLERPVVILSELQELDLVRKAELLYVGMSRAREYLVAVGMEGLERVAEIRG